MADKICCVPGCGKSRNDDVILHLFPNPDKDADRYRTWVFAIGGDILHFNDQYIFKNRRVCNHHFAEKYHNRYKRLSANAVPTLCLPGFLRRKVMKDSVDQPSTSKKLRISDMKENLNEMTEEAGTQQSKISTGVCAVLFSWLLLFS